MNANFSVYTRIMGVSDGEVSKDDHGSAAAFIKPIFEIGIVSSFWALQERGYPLGVIESEELKIVSLFSFFLTKLPENRQITLQSESHQVLFLFTQLWATL